MKYYRKKRFRLSNGHLKAPSQYYEQGMRYWAKDSQEAHKEIRRLKEEVKQLNLKINELTKG